MRSEFSERTFEFCFNSEFIQRFRGQLLSYPRIPSLQQEKSLGYDVAFYLEDSFSLFLQHKVVNHAGKNTGKNRKFFEVYNAPYIRFAIDNHQHNTLVDLSRANPKQVYYSFPSFHLRNDFEEKYNSRDISGHSLFLDPLEVGKVSDEEKHHITVNATDFSTACLHSNPKSFETVYKLKDVLIEPIETEENIKENEKPPQHDSELIKKILILDKSIDTQKLKKYSFIINCNLMD